MITKLVMNKIVGEIAKVPRSPILRRPDEYGMSYEDVSFPSMDGTVLEGWFMPSSIPSNRIVICNHFSPGNRYGYAGHLKPWKNAGGFEVNFLPKYKALVDAGYNVLAYDLRNHGFSASAQNGGYNPKFFEYKDVIGSMNYVRERIDTKNMEIHLHSVCLGGNATLVAMRKHPEVFERVKSMVLVQPISGEALVKRLSKNLRMGEKGERTFEELYRQKWGYSVNDSAPILDAPFVKVPTLVVQVREDSFTFESDVQSIYEGIRADKDLLWIEGTNQRFRGYTYFSEKPEQMIEWYDQHSVSEVLDMGFSKAVAN